MPRVLKCALAALAIIVVLFADVIFLGASLAPLDYDASLVPDGGLPAPIALFPEPASRKTTDSWGDIGAAAWEFQPSVRWMAYCLRTGESPWWNPYEAAGRMAPESLYDVSFSPITLTAAILGGSSTAISFTLVAFYFLASFSLIYSLHRYLEISFVASCTAGAVYLLSGFSLCNLFTQMGQPYFLAPLLLLSLFAFADRPSGSRFAAAALVQAMMFTVTLFPTMALAMISAYAIVMVSTQFRTAAMLCAIPVLGLGLVSFLYLPIFEAQFNYIDMMGSYGRRLTPGYDWQSALSLFTPKHFWQSYRALVAQPGWPAVGMEREVNHIGIVVALLAASGLALYPRRRITAVALISGLLAAITVGQMYGIPPFTLIDQLPFFSFIRNEYWPALAGIPIAVLLALALDNRGKGGEIPFAIATIAVAGSFAYLLVKLHLPTADPARTQVLLAAAFILAGAFAILLCLFRFPAARYARLALVFLSILEGVYYMNHLHAIRSHREDHLPETLQWVKQQLPNATGNRILNLGGSGIMPNWGGALHMPDVGALEMAITPGYQRFFETEIGTGLFLSFYQPTSGFRFTRESLSLAGVRFVIADRTFTGAIDLLNRIGLKPVREDQARIIFENPSPGERAFLTAGGAATIEEYRNTRVRVRTNGAAPGTLALIDSYHPNWIARVDGKPTAVEPFHTGFRSVPVTAGPHTVEFSYRPKTLTAGMWISAVALAVSLLLLFRRPGFSLRARYLQ